MSEHVEPNPETSAAEAMDPHASWRGGVAVGATVALLATLPSVGQETIEHPERPIGVTATASPAEGWEAVDILGQSPERTTYIVTPGGLEQTSISRTEVSINSTESTAAVASSEGAHTAGERVLMDYAPNYEATDADLIESIGKMTSFVDSHADIFSHPERIKSVQFAGETSSENSDADGEDTDSNDRNTDELAPDRANTVKNALNLVLADRGLPILQESKIKKTEIKEHGLSDEAQNLGDKLAEKLGFEDRTALTNALNAGEVTDVGALQWNEENRVAQRAGAIEIEASDQMPQIQASTEAGISEEAAQVWNESSGYGESVEIRDGEKIQIIWADETGKVHVTNTVFTATDVEHIKTITSIELKGYIPEATTLVRDDETTRIKDNQYRNTGSSKPQGNDRNPIRKQPRNANFSKASSNLAGGSGRMSRDKGGNRQSKRG